jgi:hypothetical protein
MKYLENGALAINWNLLQHSKLLMLNMLSSSMFDHQGDSRKEKGQQVGKALVKINATPTTVEILFLPKNL